MTNRTIEPIDDSHIHLATMLEGEQLVRDDPARISDLHLQHLAVYSQPAAQRARAAREKALAAAKALAQAPARPASRLDPREFFRMFMAISEEVVIPVTREAFQKRDAKIAEQRDQIAALIEHCQALERRLSAIESRPKGLQYRGVWSAGMTYSQGDTVSRRGLWIAMTVTRAMPGQSPDWSLAVKDGRDGRDLR